MEREITFRGKEIETGKWVCGYYFRVWEKCYILWGTTNGVPDEIEVDPETVGQFTGMMDKDGKEIYEGDILQIKDEEAFETSIHKVEYCGDRDYPAFDLSPYLYCDSNALSYASACCEVRIIGNIHDNRELLEAK